MDTATFQHVPEVRPFGTRKRVLTGRALTRVWGRGEAAQTAVAGLDIDLAAGEVVAIVGPSGSGKSTLGAMLAGIDRPTSGSLVAGGARIDRLGDDALADWRARNVGIVLQDFHLLPTLTASENVELALKFAGVRRARKTIAGEALAAVGLASKSRRVPAELSGGEQQRVALARAVAVRPALLVADEPTGRLDQATGNAVFEVMLSLRDRGTTIAFITHDLQLAAAADRVLEIVDGRWAR